MKWTFITAFMTLFVAGTCATETELSARERSTSTVHAEVDMNEVQLAKLSEALHKDKWDLLQACYPGLKRGENPFLSHPDYQITIGELVILMRSWDCLKNMLLSGLRANEAMIQMSGEMGNPRTYTQLMATNPIMTNSQPLRFSGDLLSLALQHGANPNARSREEGKRPLMTHDSFKDIKTLVKHGADVNAADAAGRSAIFYHTDPDILNYLIKNGADVNKKDHQGYAALDYWKEDRRRYTLLSNAGALPQKKINLIKMAYYEDYEVILNDMDDYAYMIANEKESDLDADKVVFYLASRFPTPHVRQTEDWHEFVKWLRALPPYSTLHRYVRCQHHFTSDEHWQRPYMLDKIIAPIPLSEGEERVFCVCSSEDEPKSSY